MTETIVPKQIKTFVHPVTGCIAPYTPMGRFVHIPPPFPRSDWANNFGQPWWKNETYCIGLLSERNRRVRVINTLTLEEQVLEVRIAHAYHRYTVTIALSFIMFCLTTGPLPQGVC